MSQWYVVAGSGRKGPFDVAQLRQFVDAGRLKPTSVLESAATKTRTMAADLDGLFPAAPPEPAPLPPQLVSPSPPAPGFQPIATPALADIVVEPPPVRSADSDRRAAPVLTPPLSPTTVFLRLAGGLLLCVALGYLVAIVVELNSSFQNTYVPDRLLDGRDPRSYWYDNHRATLKGYWAMVFAASVASLGPFWMAEVLQTLALVAHRLQRTG